MDSEDEEVSELGMVITEFIHELKFRPGMPNVEEFTESAKQVILSDPDFAWDQQDRFIENLYSGERSSWMSKEELVRVLGPEALAEIKAAILSQNTPEISSGATKLRL